MASPAVVRGPSLEPSGIRLVYEEGPGPLPRSMVSFALVAGSEGGRHKAVAGTQIRGILKKPTHSNISAPTTATAPTTTVSTTHVTFGAAATPPPPSTAALKPGRTNAVPQQPRWYRFLFVRPRRRSFKKNKATTTTGAAAAQQQGEEDARISGTGGSPSTTVATTAISTTRSHASTGTTTSTTAVHGPVPSTVATAPKKRPRGSFLWRASKKNKRKTKRGRRNNERHGVVVVVASPGDNQQEQHQQQPEPPTSLIVRGPFIFNDVEGPVRDESVAGTARRLARLSRNTLVDDAMPNFKDQCRPISGETLKDRTYQGTNPSRPLLLLQDSAVKELEDEPSVHAVYRGTTGESPGCRLSDDSTVDAVCSGTTTGECNYKDIPMLFIEDSAVELGGGTGPPPVGDHTAQVRGAPVGFEDSRVGYSENNPEIFVGMHVQRNGPTTNYQQQRLEDKVEAMQKQQDVMQKQNEAMQEQLKVLQDTVQNLPKQLLELLSTTQSTTAQASRRTPEAGDAVDINAQEEIDRNEEPTDGIYNLEEGQGSKQTTSTFQGRSGKSVDIKAASTTVSASNSVKTMPSEIDELQGQEQQDVAAAVNHAFRKEEDQKPAAVALPVEKAHLDADSTSRRNQADLVKEENASVFRAATQVHYATTSHKVTPESEEPQGQQQQEVAAAVNHLIREEEDRKPAAAALHVDKAYVDTASTSCWNQTGLIMEENASIFPATTQVPFATTSHNVARDSSQRNADGERGEETTGETLMRPVGQEEPELDSFPPATMATSRGRSCIDSSDSLDSLKQETPALPLICGMCSDSKKIALQEILPSIVLVGVSDPESGQIIQVGSGCIVDSDEGLIVTAAHVLFDMKDTTKDIFGIPCFRSPRGRAVIAVIPKGGSQAVVRYFAEVVAHRNLEADACVLRITAGLENGIEYPISTAQMPEQRLRSLNMMEEFQSEKLQLEEAVRIVGYCQEGEDLYQKGRGICYSADYVGGHICRNFKPPKEVFGSHQTFSPESEIVVTCNTTRNFQGHSGGPCVNSEGKVLGILSRAHSKEKERSYIVPVSEFQYLLTRAKHGV